MIKTAIIAFLVYVIQIGLIYVICSMFAGTFNLLAWPLWLKISGALLALITEASLKIKE